MFIMILSMIDRVIDILLKRDLLQVGVLDALFSRNLAHLRQCATHLQMNSGLFVDHALSLLGVRSSDYRGAISGCEAT